MGKFRLDLARTNVSALVREVVENFGPIANYAGSSLSAHLPQGEIVRICDRLALEQILDNLISNAIKYGAGQPIVVSISEDITMGHIVVRVQDHGPGISPECQARIFERFERAVRPGEHGGGFGVGLWIVRQLAEAMGGTVTIFSQPNEGSTFTVTLPLQPYEISR
jgi:signal transduction histidine kinase